MEIVSAREARLKFAEILDSSRDNPVSIQKHGKNFAILVSNERYKELVKMEEVMLSILAKRIDERNKYLDKEGSNKILNDILNA